MLEESDLQSLFDLADDRALIMLQLQRVPLRLTGAFWLLELLKEGCASRLVDCSCADACLDALTGIVQQSGGGIQLS